MATEITYRYKTKEARSLFNTYDKANNLIKAEAIVVKSTPTKIMYNLLTKLHAPKFPFKAFTEQREAVKWLLKSTSYSN